MKIATLLVTASLMLLSGGLVQSAENTGREGATLNVVATLPDYAVIAKLIGGERVKVSHIVRGDQDAHFIRPKPSFVDMVKQADVLIATGLDLELWLPTVVDRSGNARVRSGQPGYVATSQGIRLLEIPQTMSRAEGGVHVYGNPHMTCSPLNMKTAARNIATGLIKNDRKGKEVYEKNLEVFLHEMDERLFGREMVKLLGGRSLCSMAEKGTLIPFLEKNKFQGEPLIDSLGGWMKKMMPVRGKAIVTYHKNWVYFLKLFGIEEAGTVEPKPGIPPTPKHVTELIEMMIERRIGVVFAANYFDESRVRTVAQRVGAVPVIVPLYIGGEKGVDDYFGLVDLWTERFVATASVD
jgi:zinc/manganese transport system substrate-binding protein